MALYPRIQSPCPYKNNLSAVMDGDFCRMCKRHVVDLSPMSDIQRVAVLKGCSGEVCVSYSIPARLAAAAIAMAAVTAPVAAAAQCVNEIVEVVVGGIKDPSHTQFVKDDHATPMLPVVYDNAKSSMVGTVSNATPRSGT